MHTAAYKPAHSERGRTRKPAVPAASKRSTPDSPPVGVAGTIQRQCACGGGCPRCAGDAAAGASDRLTISSADDRHEKEADDVALRVVSGGERVRVSAAVPVPPTGPPDSITAKPDSGRPASAGSAADASSVAPYVGSLGGGGQAMPEPMRVYFQDKLGTDFSRVRLHTDDAAHDAASSVHAKAFTYGDHIVFKRGEYQPGSLAGMHLLAHELTHVTQQRSDTLSRRIDRTGEDNVTPQIVAQDPDLLLCFILCELGIPPALWRDVTSLFLRAVWDEYSDRYSQAQASVAFRRFETAFMAYSPLKVIQLILTFVVQGKIGLIPVRAAAAATARQALERLLISRGATAAGLAVAEQIARKIVIAIEVAIAAGCAAYCGSLAFGRAMVVLAEVTADLIVAFARGLEAAGELIGAIAEGIATELVVRPVFTALALMDVNNWRLAGMPEGTRGDMVVIGLYLSTQITGNDFDTLLTQLSRPVSRYLQSLSDLVFMVMSAVAEERVERGEEPLPYTPRQMLGESPTMLFNLLYNEGYLDFEQAPEDVVDAMIAGGGELEEGAGDE